VVALFAACFGSLLLAAGTGWAVLADVVFVMTCGLVACYTRPAGLRSVVVCPPLAFCAGSILAQLIAAPDTFSALAGVLVTLGTSTLWLFTGTALTMAIALGRGWRPGLPAAVLGNLRVALRDLRPRGDRWIERQLPGAQVTARIASLVTVGCRPAGVGCRPAGWCGPARRRAGRPLKTALQIVIMPGSLPRTTLKRRPPRPLPQRKQAAVPPGDRR
jgi:hypothetical protein